MSTREPRLQQTLTYSLLNRPTPSPLGVSYTDPAKVPAGQPPVILIHGLRGDMRVWQTRAPDPLPAPTSGNHLLPPLQLPRLAQTEAAWTDPTGMWDAVERGGFAGVSWKQNDAGGPLPGGTDYELAAVVAFALRTYRARQVYLVGHSRGGLTARAYLTHPGAAERVAVLITLGTPHYGTRIAAVAGAVEGQVVRGLLGVFGLPGALLAPFATPLIGRLLNDLTTSVFADLDMIAWKQPPNPRLLDIIAPSYFPTIRYVAVAGTYPHVLDARLYHYTPTSYLPTGFPPRFRWQETTYPPPDAPPVPLTLAIGQLADQAGLAGLQAISEVYPAGPRRPEGGDGAVAKFSAWFADEQLDPAQGYIRNYKFPIGHSLLPRRPEVQAAVVHELKQATSDEE